jgi:hypothetical protein
MSEPGGALERRYRRLLVWYPAEHRRVHGEEMIGVLLACAGSDKSRPGFADTVDLVIGGLRIRLAPPRDDGFDAGWRDTLAVASVAIPAMLAIVYAAIFSWAAYNRISIAASVPAGMIVVLAGFVLLVALAPVLALRGLRRPTVLAYCLPVLWLGWRAPVISDQDHGFFLAFLTAAAAFALSPGARRAVQIMRAWTWAVVCGIGLALCGPEVLMLRGGSPRWPIWPYTVGYELLMIVSLMLITAAGAIGLLRTLPPPVGRRLLLLLAVPAYPGAAALAASTSGSPGPLAAVVYLPTVMLACLAAGLVWRSRRRGHLRPTAESPAGPAASPRR